MICKNCKREVSPDAVFCGYCGTAVKVKKSKKSLFIGLIVGLCVISLVAAYLVITLNKDDYDKQISIGYDLIDEGNYEEAVLAFDKAIKIDEKRPEGYMGKAESMAYDMNMTPAKAEAIVAVLELGYEKSGDKKVLEHKTLVGQIIMDNGFEKEAEIVEEAEAAIVQETEARAFTDEEIITAYKDLLSKYENVEDVRYLVYDIDKNEIPELIMEEYHNDKVTVYSYNGELIKIGEVDGFYTLGSIPNDNGMLLLGYDDNPDTAKAYIVGLENDQLKYTSISENGRLIIDGKETDMWVNEQGNDGADFNDIIKGSYRMTLVKATDKYAVDMAVNTYNNEAEAYADLLKNQGGLYTYYYLYDFEKDGVKEIILSNPRTVTLNESYTAVSGDVYAFRNKKLRNIGMIDSKDTFYEYESIGIVAKSDGGQLGDVDSSEVYYLLETGIIADYPDEGGAFNGAKEIPRYEISNIEPLKTL